MTAFTSALENNTVIMTRNILTKIPSKNGLIKIFFFIVFWSLFRKYFSELRNVFVIDIKFICISDTYVYLVIFPSADGLGNFVVFCKKKTILNGTRPLVSGNDQTEVAHYALFPLNI